MKHFFKKEPLFKGNKDTIGEDEFSSLMKNLGPFEKKPEMAVAVSGGADSMALTVLADRWAKTLGGKVIALTVNHGIRKEAELEAKKVKQWLSAKNIKHHTLTYKGKKPESNIQEHARNIRYNLLTNWCKKHNIIHLLVAHHMEDQAETFLLRLHRGSGVDGLSAMASVVQKNGVRVLRPLLPVSRKKLRSYLQDIKQEWIEDPTNQNMRFARNNIRMMMNLEESENNILTSRLIETASNMAKARMALEKETAKHMVDCVTLHEGGFCIVNHSDFIKSDEEIGLRILAATLTAVSGNTTPPRFENIINLYQAIINDRLNGRTLWGCKIFKKNEQIFIYRELSAIQAPLHISSSDMLWDNRFYIKTTLKNLKIGALGQEGVRKLTKEYKSLEINNLPKQILYTLPALTDRLENILSVPHIGFYSPDDIRNKVFCSFEPAKPLAGLPFGCYSFK